MTVQLKHQLKDTAILRYTLPTSFSKERKNILFLAKCGIYQLMTNEHPSLSELYKIRYNEHGALQLNDYQKILKKRLGSLIWDIKDRDDLQLHLLIPQYTGNYFSVCVMVSSMKPIISQNEEGDYPDSKTLFSSYNNFSVQHSDFVSLHLDQMSDEEIKKLFRIACTENNNGDLRFQLSVGMEGIPGFLFEEYHFELGIHEIEVLQSIVNFQVNHYDLPRIQLNDRYARAIGWNINDQLVSIVEPKKIATFGNERIMLQALWMLQNFHLKHQHKKIEIIDPHNGKRSIDSELHLTMDHSYYIITTKTKHWEQVIQSLTLNHTYHKQILAHLHSIEDLGLDMIQLFQSNRDLLFSMIKSWVNIMNSSQGASYEMQSLLELFDDAFKTYGSEQLAELQMRMFLKESTFDDLAHPELHNTLVSKYSSIFGHPFFNFKEKVDIAASTANRRLWKRDIQKPGIHIIDVSGLTQQEQLAIHSFFLILQEARYFSNSWTLHSFGDGLRHSFEKVQQVIQGIDVARSLLHFTHCSSMPFFLGNFELMLFDREFSTYSVLKSFSANTLFENSGDTNLMIYEQADVTLLKPLDLQMLDSLFDHNVLVKLSADEKDYSHDLYPAKELEDPILTTDQTESEPIDPTPTESVLSQPFVEEEEDIEEEFEEDSYIGPDLLFKIPVLATFRSYRNYQLQEIEYSSNLPADIINKQLRDLMALGWIESTIVDKVTVYLPLSKGKHYMEGLLKLIPDLVTIQDNLFDEVFPDLSSEDGTKKIIDENNVLDVLLTIRLSYHDLTEFEERKETLLNLCSVCEYISNKFGDFDNVLISYYYWTIGILASFLGSQLDDKKEEHLLALKISQVIKLISDIITSKLQDDFAVNQIEASSDEAFVFTEAMKEEEVEAPSILSQEKPELTMIIPKRVEPQRTPPLAPPSVLNIPKTANEMTLSTRQLTPSELKPIEISNYLGPWFKFHRVDYNRPITADPLTLTTDEIIFMFMVNAMNNNMSESFSIKKESKSLMFLNEQQVYETANRSPLPMQIDYDKLISSGVIEPMDIGYNLLDIRSILPHPNVSVDPMYKRMNLNEVIELLDENRYNFIHSGTLQSYIYADYYDLELQPVVAICYALLIDQDETKVKISKYSKYIPWVYTVIKLFLLKKRDFMRSADLNFVHELLVDDLKKIHVASSQELLEYSGENLTGIKLSFLLRRKFKKLGLSLSDINKHANGTEKISTPISDEKTDQSLAASRVRKRDRIIFSPTLVQQIEQEAIEITSDERPAKSTIVKKIPIKRHTPKQGKITTDEKVSEITIPTDQGDEIRFSTEGISQISEICNQAIDSPLDTSPTDLLVSIFAQAIYPEVIGKTPKILDLKLIEVFNEVGEMTGVSNTVDFSRNLGDMQERWDKFEDTRERIITSFVGRINNIASHFVFNSLFRDLLERKINRIKS